MWFWKILFTALNMCFLEELKWVKTDQKPSPVQQSYTKTQLNRIIWEKTVFSSFKSAAKSWLMFWKFRLCLKQMQKHVREIKPVASVWCGEVKFVKSGRPDNCQIKFTSSYRQQFSLVGLLHLLASCLPPPFCLHYVIRSAAARCSTAGRASAYRDGIHIRSRTHLSGASSRAGPAWTKPGSKADLDLIYSSLDTLFPVSSCDTREEKCCYSI